MGDNMAKSPYKIPAGAGYKEAANYALRVQAAELLHNLSGTVDGDVEALHDMRVASRRMRAAMSVFAEAYPAKKFRPIEKQVAEVTDALGAVRDADVLLEYLDEALKTLPEAAKVGVNALAESLRSDRERDRLVLIRDLERLQKSKFQAATEDLVGGPIEAKEEETNG